MAVYFEKVETVTGLWFCQAVQGDYTANNNNKIGLYSLSEGVLTLRASCADDGNLWKSAAGFYKKAFATPYNVSQGLYYAAYIYSNSAEVANPTLGRTVAISATSLLFTGDNSYCKFLATQTDLPASITLGDCSNTTTCFWVGVYNSLKSQIKVPNRHRTFPCLYMQLPDYLLHISIRHLISSKI